MHMHSWSRYTGRACTYLPVYIDDHAVETSMHCSRTIWSWTLQWPWLMPCCINRSHLTGTVCMITHYSSNNNYVNASSRNGTLGTTPVCTPQKWVFGKCGFEYYVSQNFSYFFKEGVQFLIHFYVFWAIPHIWCAKSSISSWCVHIWSCKLYSEMNGSHVAIKGL